MNSERLAILHPDVYELDPALAESIARDLGVTLIVRDTLFPAYERLALAVCERLDRVQFDLPRFAMLNEIDNRAQRRRMRFARRTNSDGWKA